MLHQTPETNPNILAPTIDFTKVRIEAIFDALTEIERSVGNSFVDKALSHQQAAWAMFNPSVEAAPKELAIQTNKPIEPARHGPETDASSFAKPARVMSAYFADQGASI